MSAHTHTQRSILQDVTSSYSSPLLTCDNTENCVSVKEFQTVLDTADQIEKKRTKTKQDATECQGNHGLEEDHSFICNTVSHN